MHEDEVRPKTLYSIDTEQVDIAARIGISEQQLRDVVDKVCPYCLHARSPGADSNSVDDVRRRLEEEITELRRLAAALREQTIRDPLTGLFNRRFLEETLERETHLAERNDSPLAIVICDIDHFKLINDAFGHYTGDLVLKKVGELFASITRRSDVACRYGGEEFVLVLPGVSHEAAMRKAEQVRLAARDMAPDRNLVSVSFSLGVASYPAHGETWGSVLRAADAALYQAKTSGRNRTVSA